jgi:3-dehydroquinate synthase
MSTPQSRLNTSSMFFLYGPPGTGKSSAGRLLAQALDLPFWDLDAEIEARTRKSIPALFAKYGESGFRKREQKVLETLLRYSKGVISLGGGALLDAHNRFRVEARGKVLCLDASLEDLLQRLGTNSAERPLLAGDTHARLEGLMAVRAEHYASFDQKIDTRGMSSPEIAAEAQVRMGAFHVRGMGVGYDVRVQSSGVDNLGAMLVARGASGPIVVVSDENVSPHYSQRIIQSLRVGGFACSQVTLPPGEHYKTLESVTHLWEAFTAARLERGSTVVALGGGVVGDLAGFAAATYLRGIQWVAVPTSLLAMVDASLGGKTGFDLPSGKNLVGAFYSPRLVLSDPQTLATLPEAELRSGLAEVVKHGVIGDPRLFSQCAQGWQAVMDHLEEIVCRAMAVKVRVIQADPYEGGQRAALNLGHTLGHALELVSGYRMRHGEAVAVGMTVAAQISERMGLAQIGLAEEIASVLHGLNLPTEIPPDLDRAAVLSAIGFDKKRASGKVGFVLPVRVGEVKTGVDVSAELNSLLETW